MRDAVCLILCGLTGVAIWAFFGAAICRTAAVRLAADEQVGFGAALRYACRKWPAYFAAPLLPIGGVILVTIAVLVLGWIMRTNVGLVLVGFLWPLVLVAGFLMAILLLGVLFGFPLMWGTIGAEGTDSFDALSRSYAYVFQRPLRYLFYIVVAGLLGWLGWIVVWNFAEGVIWLGYWAAGWGCGRTRSLLSAPAKGSATSACSAPRMIHFWPAACRLLAVGYMFSYFWTASAAIYFLLRHDVDATEMDEVFLDADATRAGCQPAGSGADQPVRRTDRRSWQNQPEVDRETDRNEKTGCLHRSRSAGAVVDLNRLVGGKDEDLAVADGSLGTGAGRADDRLDRAVQKIVVDDDLQNHLPQQRGRVFVAAEHLGPAPLTPKPLGVADRQPRDFDPFQRLADGAEFRRLDDGDHEFHGVSSLHPR